MLLFPYIKKRPKMKQILLTYKLFKNRQWIFFFHECNLKMRTWQTWKVNRNNPWSTFQKQRQRWRIQRHIITYKLPHLNQMRAEKQCTNFKYIMYMNILQNLVLICRFVLVSCSCCFSLLQSVRGLA